MHTLRPLRGTRVADFSLQLPGAYLSRILADLGADVVKIEPPQGDPIRRMPPFVGECSALHAALNYGKKSLVVDLKDGADLPMVMRLMKQADVLVESFRPGVMTRLGMGYDIVSAQKPELVYCSVTGFGQSGHQASKAGHDLNFMARSGLLGTSESLTHSIPMFQAGDIAGGGLWGVIGILTALMEKQKTGKGCHLDIGMTPRVAHLLAYEISRTLAGEDCEQTQGFLSGALPCYNLYKTQDQLWMSFAAIETKFFDAFCTICGRDDLRGMGYLTGDAGARVIVSLREIFASRTQAQWVEELKDVDCCCEPLSEPKDAAIDPSLKMGWFALPQGAMALYTGFDNQMPGRKENWISDLNADRETVLGAWGDD
jgi:alpha-methylacyl-CoA racemase